MSVVKLKPLNDIFSKKTCHIVAFYCYKSIDLTFTINERFSMVPNCEISGQKAKGERKREKKSISTLLSNLQD